MICDLTEHMSLLQLFFCAFCWGRLFAWFLCGPIVGGKGLIVTWRQMLRCDITRVSMHIGEARRACICMCAYMYPCRHACLCACGCSHVLLHTCVKILIACWQLHARVHNCVHVCTYVYLYMSECMYVWCVCVYVCVYVWMYVCLYISACRCTYMYACVCVYAHMCAYMCILCVYMYIYYELNYFLFMYIYVYIYVYVYMCVYVFICMYIYIYISIYIYINIYIYIYIYILWRPTDDWQMWWLTKEKTKIKREHWTKRWNWSSCTKLALRASWIHGLIAQSVRASEWNSVVVGSNPTQANFL